jgi:large subunit ribosomal protein L18
MKTLKRRRRESKTDYGIRFKLLKSEKPRLVFRKTNKYVIGQYVISKETKDETEIGVNSKQLLKHGWPEKFKNSLKSMPASYLTGFLIGKKILKEKKENPIADFGMIKNIHKTKVFAFLKGVADAGVEIKHKENTFPSEERIMGKNLKEDFSGFFDKIKSSIEKE